MSTAVLHLQQSRAWLTALLGSHEVFVPTIADGKVHWHRPTDQDISGAEETLSPALSRIRASEPVKSFFFSPREQVASFPEKLEPRSPGSRVLFGVKGCDVAAIRANDVMFRSGEFQDPFYVARREKTVLVGADCPEPEDSCFCNLVGGRPYAADGVDVSVSVVDGRIVAEVSTKAGQDLVDAVPGAFEPAPADLVKKRDSRRAGAEKRLAEINPTRFRLDLPAALSARTTDSAYWADGAKTCVECFGCLMTCPTCYCFLLYDRMQGSAMERTKVWDACYLAAYQRVGGGANPRGRFLTRFANRFHCKFEHFWKTNGFYACSGCGRCFRVCMGKIDIRKILGAA